MSLRYLVLLVLSVLLFTACTTPTAPRGVLSLRAQNARRNVSLNDLQQRIAACREIGDGAARDDALTTVALDAAASGHGDFCVLALKEMQEGPGRDVVAADCARLAVRHGTLASARQSSALVQDLDLRDALYGEIARSSD